MGFKHLTTTHHLIKYSVSRSHTVVSSLEPKLCEGDMAIKTSSKSWTQMHHKIEKSFRIKKNSIFENSHPKTSQKYWND